MTREEVLKEFKVNEYGIIRTPGKFEGEMLYAPWFYDAVMNGDGEDVYEDSPDDLSDAELDACPPELLYTELDVTDEDRAEFPELDPTTTKVRVSCISQGFVYVEEVS